jgi:hypothetical protein
MHLRDDGQGPKVFLGVMKTVRTQVSLRRDFGHVCAGTAPLTMCAGDYMAQADELGDEDLAKAEEEMQVRSVGGGG